MSGCIGVARFCLLAVLAVGAASSTGLAGDQPDPFAPGPAAPAKPARPAAGQDPFGARPGPAGFAQRMAIQPDPAQALMQVGRLVQLELLDASQDAIVLDDALILVNIGQRNPEATEAVAKLAKHPWQRSADESIRDFLSRLDRTAQARADETKRQLEKLEGQFGKVFPEPRPWDWRARREIWLELVELMLATRTGEDVTARWHQAATAHADLARLYRIAYLCCVRDAKTDKLDYAFVKPLGADPPSGPEPIRWSAETLTALLVANSAAEDPTRVETRAALFDALRNYREVAPAEAVLARSLGELYRTALQRKAPEAESLLETMLVHRPRYSFVRFAGEAGIPTAVQRQLLLAKPVFVTSRDALPEALGRLAGQTLHALWIDQELQDKERDTPVASCDGPWLPTVEKLLHRTEYRLHLLSPDLFWIGNPRGLEAARQLYQSSASKMRWAELKPGAALDDVTRMEFIETPLGQVLDFLSDQHDLCFVLLGPAETPVTLSVRDLPLHLGLTLMAQRLQCDWCADREIVFVGPRDQLERIRQRIVPSLQRWARLGLAVTAVTRALRGDTRLEFIETPLFQVGDFLSDQHDVPVRVAPAQREKRVTLNLKGVTFEQALDVMCLKLGVPWDTDGKSIVIGEEKP